MATEPNSFYPFGGMRNQPRQGASNQTSGIGSKWIRPEFAQPIGVKSGKPEERGGQVTGSTPGSLDFTTSEVGALQRIDSYVAIKESHNRLAVAPPLPTSVKSVSKRQKDAQLRALQLQFMNASNTGNDKRMREALSSGAKLNGVPVK